MMPERHTPANIADHLSDTIKEYSILVFWTVHDNASTIPTDLLEIIPKDLGCTGHTRQLAIKIDLVLSDVLGLLMQQGELSATFITQQWPLAPCGKGRNNLASGSTNSGLTVRSGGLPQLSCSSSILSKGSRCNLHSQMKQSPNQASRSHLPWEHHSGIFINTTYSHHGVPAAVVDLQPRQISPFDQAMHKLLGLCIVLCWWLGPSHQWMRGFFSLAGNTITQEQASLHPAHVDDFMFLHANQIEKEKLWLTGIMKGSSYMLDLFVFLPNLYIDFLLLHLNEL